jgi:hypothetical protein
MDQIRRREQPAKTIDEIVRDHLHQVVSRRGFAYKALRRRVLDNGVIPEHLWLPLEATGVSWDDICAIHGISAGPARIIKRFGLMRVDGKRGRQHMMDRLGVCKTAISHWAGKNHVPWGRRFEFIKMALEDFGLVLDVEDLSPGGRRS